MTLNYDISRYADLHERLPRFAEICGELVVLLGLEKTGGRGPKAEAASDRVIRDYVRRRVLSPTLRDTDSDERGFYGFRHLVEFLAARVLLNDGWPLDKIAERNRFEETDALLVLIPGQERENAALVLARSFQAGATRAPASPAGPKWRKAAPVILPPADSGQGMAEPFVFTPPLDAVPDSAAERTVVSAQRRAELPMLMRLLTGDTTPPSVGRRISIAIGDKILVLVDPDWLQGVSVATADDVGRAVSAALIEAINNPRGKDARP